MAISRASPLRSGLRNISTRPLAIQSSRLASVRRLSTEKAEGPGPGGPGGANKRFAVPNTLKPRCYTDMQLHSVPLIAAAALAVGGGFFFLMSQPEKAVKVADKVQPAAAEIGRKLPVASAPDMGPGTKPVSNPTYNSGKI